MKTLLVPTDFSPVALNAAHYAAEIASLTDAKIILLHVYDIPTLPSETLVFLPMEEVEQAKLMALETIKDELALTHSGKLDIECKALGGFPASEINAFAQKNHVDLIIMGMVGAGYFAEKLVGSITTTLLRKAKCPVLAIHKDVAFKSIKKIMLACDYEETENKAILEPLKELARLFKSHIYILNVSRELETVPSVDHAVAGITLDHSLEEFNHSFHSTVNDDLIEGMNDFAAEKQVDMVVMIPRMHNVLQRVFHEPNTKRMAFHNAIPLLALH